MRKLTCFLLLTLSATVYAEERLLVLDASGSMWGRIDGRAKIELARDSIAELVAGWPKDHPLGLMAYGHRRKGDCNDIELLLPVARVATGRYVDVVESLQPKGMTPIAASLTEAARVLRATEQKATVILISDGEETCAKDPCAIARDLEHSGVDFTAHIIGFDVPDPKHQAQLRCMAEATGGRFLNARDARELGAALKSIGADQALLPPAQATLTSADQTVAAARYALTFTGPGTAEDWIGFAPETGDSLSYLAESGTWQRVDSSAGALDLRAPSTPGRYALRYVSPARQKPILATRIVIVSPASSIVRGPIEAMANDTILVEADGPFADDHWIGFARKGSAPGDYVGTSWIRPDPSGRTRATLTAPEEPGDYELRYVLKEGAEVIGRQSIRVIASAGAFLDSPTRVQAASSFDVAFTGPRNPSGGAYIGIVPSRGSSEAYITYCNLPESGPCTISAPADPGSFDLIYVVAGSKILARSPLIVEP